MIELYKTTYDEFKSYYIFLINRPTNPIDIIKLKNKNRLVFPARFYW